MTTMDIFNSAAFNVVSMTKAINKAPFTPTRISELGLFSEEGIATTGVWFEEIAGVLSLIPAQSRNGTVAQNTTPRAKMRYFAATHLPLEDNVLPDAIQNVRDFGSADATVGIATAVNNKLVNMKAKHNATNEFHRLGAVKGVVLDADGTTVIRNLYTEFGLTQQVIFFDLDNVNADMADKVALVGDAVDAKIGGDSYTGIHAFVGTNFFGKLTKHASVKELWKFQQGQQLLNMDRRSGATFTIGNVTFEKMSRTVGGIQQVGADDAHFFPLGVGDLFKTFWAPANMNSAVNTIGLPYYAHQEARRHERGIDIYTESNPLNICTRPEVLIKGVVAAS